MFSDSYLYTLAMNLFLEQPLNRRPQFGAEILRRRQCRRFAGTTFRLTSAPIAFGASGRRVRCLCSGKALAERLADLVDECGQDVVDASGQRLEVGKYLSKL